MSKTGYLQKIILSWRIIFQDIPNKIWQRHLFLFAATFISMTWTYYTYSLADNIADRLIESLLYSSVLSIILLSHELGHYIHARQYGVETTLPLFIPLPFLSPFGTLGAFIRMKGLPPDKRALFDISYWGPAMSFFTSVPAIIIGLLLSENVPVAISETGLLVGNNHFIFGSSILFNFISSIINPVPDGYSMILHPIAFAGWVGLFVTAINLFPIGQLDGGHIAYVFLGKRQKYIAYLFFAILIFLALEVSQGWVFWVFMLFFMGIRHPNIRMLQSGINMDKIRIRQGILSAIIFVICFIPEPLKLNAKIIPKSINSPVHERKQEFKNFHNINFTSKHVFNNAKHSLLIKWFKY
ncbi:MAG: site-2 protease family protein [Spirochaetia bacterium]|nr:site-2 protease family protein [Spirochaetia bacterium]